MEEQHASHSLAAPAAAVAARTLLRLLGDRRGRGRESAS